MLCALHDRRFGLFTLGISLLLLVTTLSGSPGSAEDVDPSSHWFSVEIPNQVWAQGENWPLDATINLTIDDSSGGVTFTASTQVEQMGSQAWEVGFRFDLSESFEIQPSHVVAITSDFDNDGTLDVDKELLVAEIHSIGVLPLEGIVHGYAAAGTWVNVNAGNDEGWAWRNVQADSEGLFTANFVNEVDVGEEGEFTLAVPLPDGTGGSAQITDDDGDSTTRSWCIGCDGGQEEPSVVASVWPDTYVRGWGWQGADLYITLDKSPVDGEPDWDLDLPVDTYEDGIQYNGGDFEVRAPFWGTLTLDDGDVLTVTAAGGEGDDVVKALIVTRPLTIEAVDRSLGTIEGTAETGREVNVTKWGDDFGHQHTEVTVDVSNNSWTATLPQLWAGSGGAATIWDGDGDGTEAVWGAPFIATGVDAPEGTTSVWGGFWYLDDEVTVEITRAEEAVYGPIDVPVQDDWWRGFGTELGGFELQVDDVVTVTGTQSETVNTHTVLALTVDWEDAGEDGAGNTVFGTTSAPAGWIVSVGADDAQRSAYVDEFGGWSIDFDDPSETSGHINIEQGVGGQVEVLDLIGNRTWAPWGTGGAGAEGEPFLHVSAFGEEFIHGNNFDSDDLRVIEITNDVVCAGRVYTNEWEWQFDGAQFCEDGDLKPGHNVKVSYVQADGETPGELIRELVVHDVVITDADLTDDTVMGLASPGSPVLVGIVADPGDPFSFHAQRVVSPEELGPLGEWSVSFAEEPAEVSDENWGHGEIDEQEVKVFQFDEDGDFTTSDWMNFDPHLLVNVLADFAILQGWPTGSDITLDVFESDTEGALLVHSETIAAPGPYYTVHAETDLGGIDVLSGQYVVASNGVVEVSHAVTEVSITSFDFENDSFTGTAFADTTVVAGASNGEEEWEIDDLFDRPWTADFSGHVDFGASNHIDGFIAEFDGAQNATFFMFAAEYEELTVAPGETSVTTGDGSVTVENLGEGDETSIVTGPPPGSSGGFEYVGESLTIESDATGTPSDPLILTLRISGEDIPPDLDPEDIVVFKDRVEVSNCVLPLDTADDFPCVSERLRLEPSGDIELTVQTLSFSTWTMAFRSVTIAQFTATVEPVAVDTEVTATGWLLDAGKTQATGLTSTVIWSEGGDCEVVPVAGDGIEASHTYLEAGVFTPTLRLYAGVASDCATAMSLELIDEAAFQYVVVYDPDGGFVTGGGWVYSAAESYVPDPTLEGIATFGFVSMYKKGASTPTGNTEFQFHAGDLKFNSTTYDWLVVTGSDFARFKGEGTINGEGEYNFQIWAGDGDPDTFRIKIWTEDEVGDESVVYDNGFDQEIGGGSIVIHTKK